MTQHPAAGWYADPAGTSTPPLQRYWDGAGWTEHTAPAPLPTYNGKERTTPDGVPLAGWGRRLSAYLIDAVVLAVLNTVLGFPFIRVLGPRYLDFIQETVDRSEAGGRPPTVLDFYGDNTEAVLGYAAVTIVVLVAYHFVMLRMWSGTVGKLVLGIRVRRRDLAGDSDRLPWSTILRRVGTQHWPALLAWIPYLGIVGLWAYLDGFWPLWDRRRQALHDKFAGTNVVDVKAPRGL